MIRSLLEAGLEYGETSKAELPEASVALRTLALHTQRYQATHACGPRAALVATVFGESGYQREVDDVDLRYVLLPSVLQHRRGSCVGLGTLFLALGSLLGVPVQGVLRPGHFYVLVGEGAENVELLRGGEIMPSAWYDTRFPIAGEPAPAYGRALEPKEVLAVIAYNIGNQRRQQGRLFEARRAYESAARDFPDLAEANASLGAVLHLLGELEQANAYYGAAQRAYPHLPGLQENWALLRAEHGQD